MAHALEDKLNAPAADIMEAILKGFRAQADVKGKLAELYCSRALDDLKARNVIQTYVWNDKDGEPDFIIEMDGIRIVVEVKNIRSGAGSLAGKGWGMAELQKTRNGTDADGKKTRGYSKNHFDVLGVCLFNQTGKWEYCYADSYNLVVRASDAEILEIFQKVTYAGDAVWTVDLETVLRSVAADGHQQARDAARELARVTAAARKKPTRARTRKTTQGRTDSGGAGG